MQGTRAMFMQDRVPMRGSVRKPVRDNPEIPRLPVADPSCLRLSVAPSRGAWPYGPPGPSSLAPSLDGVPFGPSGAARPGAHNAAQLLLPCTTLVHA